jgi:hypothetical protein
MQQETKVDGVLYGTFIMLKAMKQRRNRKAG